MAPGSEIPQLHGSPWHTPVPDCPEKQGFTKRTFNQLEGKWLGDDLNTVSKSYFKAAPS